MALTIDKEISRLRQTPIIGKYLRTALQRIQDGMNNLGSHIGVDPTGVLPAPNPPNGINIATDGSNLVHATITDNSEKQKNSRYFVEWADNPGFLNSHVEDYGASRGRVLSVPQGQYYFRAYKQLPWSTASEKVNHGGDQPAPVVINSGSTLTLLPSQGSGTAAPDGSEPGQGLGTNLFRPATGPKRTSGT